MKFLYKMELEYMENFKYLPKNCRGGGIKMEENLVVNHGTGRETNILI